VAPDNTWYAANMIAALVLALEWRWLAEADTSSRPNWFWVAFAALSVMAAGDRIYLPAPGLRRLAPCVRLTGKHP
jgi:uncharacterized membrane protein